MKARTRTEDEMRSVEIITNFTDNPAGSVLIKVGNTRVLCTASVENKVPRHCLSRNQGWVTAEYSMLPGSTHSRSWREVSRGKVGGRTAEIQRLIGRSLRGITDLKLLADKTIWLDCDVLQADGGTRCASITGAYVALVLALKKIEARGELAKWPLKDSIAAVSCGMVRGAALLDLEYVDDVAADVDMNVVMTGSGRFVEVQATGEEATFSQPEFLKLLALAEKGIGELTALQEAALEG